MDVVGATGYIGQSLECLSEGRLGFISGNALNVLGADGTPDDMLWRDDTGIAVVAVSTEADIMAVAPNVDGGDIEILKLSDKSSIGKLPTAVKGRLVEMTFSSDGSRLFGISDLLDHNLIVWDVQNEDTLVKYALGTPSKNVVPDPLNPDRCAVSSADGVDVIEMVLIIGEYEVRKNRVSVTASPSIAGSDGDMEGAAPAADTICCLAWAPNDRLIVGTKDGYIVEVNVPNASTTYFTRLGGDARPRAVMLSVIDVVVVDSTGCLNWYPRRLIGTDVYLKPEQLAKLAVDGVPQAAVCARMDSTFSNIFVGCKGGSIFKVSITKIEKDEDEDDEDAANVVEETIMEIAPAPFVAFQSGATLCAKSFSAGIIKASDRSSAGRGGVSLYVNGSHTGALTFWQIPAIAGEKRVGEQNGIKDVRLHTIPKVSTALPRASPVTAIEVLNVATTNESRYLAVGHLDGWVTVVRVDAVETKIENSKDPKLSVDVTVVQSVHLFQGAVAMLQANAANAYCAVGSLSDTTVYVIDSGVVAGMTIFGYVTTDATAVKVVWENSDMWILTTGNELVKFKFVGGLKSPFERVSSWAVDKMEAVHCAARLQNGCTLLCSHESIEPMLLGKLPVGNADSSQPLSEATTFSALPALTSTVLCCAEQPTGEHAAMGTVDGSVIIVRVDENEKFAVNVVARLHLHSCPILSVTFSPDSSVVISTAGDGSTFFVSLQGAEALPDLIKTSASLYTEDANTKMIADLVNVESSLWIERRRAKDDVDLKMSMSGATANIKEAVADLTLELHALLTINENASELEQLDRRDFVVDVQGKDSLVKANADQAESIANDYHMRNMQNNLVAARIRTMCWDSMEMKGRPVLPIVSEDPQLQVSSFSVKKYSAEEEMVLRRTKRLRAIEIRSMRDHSMGSIEELPCGAHRCSWSDPVEGLRGTVSWLSNDGSNWPCADVLARHKQRLVEEEHAKNAKAAEAAEDDENGLSPVDVAEESEFSLGEGGEKPIDFNNVFSLLYPPSAVRTEVQKRTQMVLLKEVIRLVKIKYNEEHWRRLAGDKEDVIAGIKSRNIRIEEIMEELRIQEDLFQPTLAQIEIDGSTMVVDDSEITARPFETESMRIIREKAEEDRKRAEAEAAKGDIKGRALKEMMHGTLEVKKDVLGGEAIEKPEWMDDIPYDQMNDMQKKDFDEFEYNFKQVQEEQAKYRKALEVELKRLKAETMDAVTGFDNKLREMVVLKVIVEREILNHELHISQHALSIVEREQAWFNLKATESALNTAKGTHKSLIERVERFSAEVDAAKVAVEGVREDSKILEKSFKRDLQDACNVTFDQDALKIYVNLYRVRHYPFTQADDKTADDTVTKEGSLETGSVVDVGVGDKDPFYDAMKAREVAAQHKALKVPLKDFLTIENDCPEGFSSAVDDNIWNALNHLRNAQIEKEIEETRLSAVYDEEKRKLDVLVLEESAVAADIESLRRQAATIRGELGELQKNIEIIVTLKQGQDEIQNNAVITDYSSAILLPVDVVRKYNTRIKDLGNDKISVMQRIMSFRRKINMVDWESQHLELQANHLEEYFTDMQLLRVTRGLQRVIREGANMSQLKQRVDRVVARKDYMTNDTDTKLGKLQEAIDNIQKSIDARTAENDALQSTIVDMTKQVDARQTVQNSRDDARGPAGDPAVMAMRKMKRVVARRHLVDTARVQAEELDFLRHELDKVRQRTFPSFVRAAKTRLVNPDQRS